MIRSARVLFAILSCISLLLGLTQSIFADNLSITATVPANPNSYSQTIQSDKGTTVGQDQTLTYTINYGTTLSYTTPLTIKAKWTRGTVAGSSDPTVDILTYLTSSASNAYGSTAPVINTINRTITWTISNFPASTTNQTVTFKLRTSSSLVSSTNIGFTVSSFLEGPGVTTTPVANDKYFNTGSSSPTSTPTPRPTATPTPETNTPTPTPEKNITPTPTPQASLEFTDVSVRTIAPDEARIAIQLSNPGKVTLNYGTNLTKLASTVTDGTFALSHILRLSDLSPATTYYFQIRARDQNKKITSDIFTAITGAAGDIPLPALSTLVVTSNDTILSSPLQEGQSSSPGTVTVSTLVIPSDTTYDFRITIPNSQTLKQAQAVVRNHNILGLFSFTHEVDASNEAVDLIEISPHIFAGKLKSPLTSGLYDLFLRLYDTSGNITEKKISQVRVLGKFTVLNRRTEKPIEDARVLIHFWNNQKKRYELLHPTSTSITNPNFTDHKGLLNIVLPRGKYKAKVSNLNYVSQTVEFSIGDGKDDGYPTVTLTEQGFNLRNVFYYYLHNITEVFWPQTSSYIGNLAISQRIFDLTLLLTITIFFLLVILSLSARVQISVFSLPTYVWYLYKRTFTKSIHVCTLTGGVSDSISEQGVSGCVVYVRDDSTGQLISHTNTNSQGKFTLTHLCNGPYTLTFLKQGYRPFSLSQIFPSLTSKPVNIALSAKEKHHTALGRVTELLREILATGFEVIMLMLLFFAVAIGTQLGLMAVSPLIFLALFNLLTWILHGHHTHA